MKTKASVTSEIDLHSIRILKTATCPSLSGKSKLTYNVGVDPKGEIHVRVHANSSSGFFSRQWMPMSAIQQVLSTVPNDKTITSFLLQALYSGKSCNNSGFLWALLKAEGLVKLREDKQRCYALTDGRTFFADVKALRDKGVDLKVEEPKKRGAKTIVATSAKNTKVEKPATVIAKQAADDTQWPVVAPDIQPKVDTKSKQVAPKLKQKTASKKAIAKTNPQSALGL